MRPDQNLNIFRILKDSPPAAEIVRIIGIVGHEFTQDILKFAIMHLEFFEAGYVSNKDIQRQLAEEMGLEAVTSNEPVRRTRQHLSVVKG